MFSSSPTDESTTRRSSHNYLDCERSAEHIELTEQFCKTLYYGNDAPTDYPSLPLTEIAVKFFQDAAPRSLGKVDMFLASSMSKRAPMSPCSVMIGMLYVKRLKERNPEYLMQISSTELFLISMMMASKYLYDEGLNEEVFNEEWAIVGMLETAEMNQLEQYFLAAIDWRLMVRQREFKLLLNAVEKKIALNEGLKRGWFSYTDIWFLADGTFYSDLCKRTGQELLEIFAAGSVTYVAGVLTLLASSLLTMSLTSKLTTLISHPAATFLPEICSTYPYEMEGKMFDPALNMENVYSIDDSLVRKSFVYYDNLTTPITPVFRADGVSGRNTCIKTTKYSSNQENETDIWVLCKLLEMSQASASKASMDQPGNVGGSLDEVLLPEGDIASDQFQDISLTAAADGHLSRMVPHVSISTALLNLAALFSLKSPLSHEVDKPADRRCKHCCDHHHSVTSKVNMSFPRCRKEAAHSMKCSWSRIQSCLRSRKSTEIETPANSNSENSSFLTAFTPSLHSCPTTVLPLSLPTDRLNNPVFYIPNSSRPSAKTTTHDSFSNCSNTHFGTFNPKHVDEKQKERSLGFKVPNLSHFLTQRCSNLVSSSHLRPPGLANMIIHSC
ncbi:uncharacterized protein LOC115223488 [Argonauta hians]